MRRWAELIAVPLTGVLAICLAGCYHGSARNVVPAQLRADPGWTIVQAVPEVRQTSAHDCGVAALSMVLQRWGTAASSRDEVARDLGGEGGGIGPAGAAGRDAGVAAGALRDLARRRGLRAFLLNARIADLSLEIGAGRPVLVGLVQRYGDRTLAHYEVVVGVNARARRLLLYDPAHGPREDGFDGFAEEWDRTGDLAIVVTGWRGPS